MAQLKIKQFLDNLDLDEAVTAEYAASYDRLKEIRDAIEERLNVGLNGTPINIEIERGFQAKMGRQLNVKLRIPAKNYQDGLFRAYIPDAGKPVFLDLYGEELVGCNSDDELQDALIQFIENIKDRIATYRSYAGG